MDDTKEDSIDDIKKVVKKEDFIFIEKIGSGSYGSVIKVEKDNKKYAMKVIRADSKNKIRPEKVREFRGKNLVKILKEKSVKLIETKKETEKEKEREIGKNFYYYVMELSFIGCLLDIYKYLNSNLIFKEAFVEKFGDNLTRFFVSQMVNAFRTFYQGNLIHYDIKPDNMLIFKGLEIKIIDFSFLKKLNPEKTGKIPGGTFGYQAPECFYNHEYNYDILQKQDYFALGMTIFYLKYGNLPIRGFNTENKSDYTICSIRSNITSEGIERAKHAIKSEKYQDKDFTEFLYNLIQFNPKDRLNFEDIKRNKWLSKNTNEIRKIKNINLNDEDSLIQELQKSDFIINNAKYYRKKNFDERYKNDNDNIKYKQIRKGKFKFGKRE